MKNVLWRLLVKDVRNKFDRNVVPLTVLSDYLAHRVMKWFTDFLSSSVGRKLLMALTGFFLILFLTVHLAGNLQLLKHDGGRSFNIYAEFMGSNPIIQTVSKVNFVLILIHIAWSIALTRKNKTARGAQPYAKADSQAPWTSRNMGLLGSLIALFLVVHLRHFYAEAHWGGIPIVVYESETVQDLYRVVAYWFSKGWYVALYVACMGALAFHLWHGFASAFQTLGVNHPKYTPLIGGVGKAFAILVPSLYAAIPIIMFFF